MKFAVVLSLAATTAMAAETTNPESDTDIQAKDGSFIEAGHRLPFRASTRSFVSVKPTSAGSKSASATSSKPASTVKKCAAPTHAGTAGAGVAAAAAAIGAAAFMG